MNISYPEHYNRTKTIITINSHKLSPNPRTQPQEAHMHQLLYARNVQLTIAHLEWNHMTKSQIDRVI